MLRGVKPILDLTGQRYGRLTALRCVGRDPHKRALWLCQCDCGNLTEVMIGRLRTGNTKSCGCLRLRQRGLSRSTMYRKWRGMLDRCYNANARAYHRYGGRGIIVCDRWRESFQNFLADMGEKPEGLSLERIDNDGPYSPDNCKWATPKEQSNNRRTKKLIEFKGETATLAVWALKLGIKPLSLATRLRRLPVNAAFDLTNFKGEIN